MCSRRKESLTIYTTHNPIMILRNFCLMNSNFFSRNTHYYLSYLSEFFKIVFWFFNFLNRIVTNGEECGVYAAFKSIKISKNDKNNFWDMKKKFWIKIYRWNVRCVNTLNIVQRLTDWLTNKLIDGYDGLVVKTTKLCV